MKKIASLRKEINELIITDRNSERLQELSRELDKLIIEFYARKNDSA
ncbi:MAG: Spo0E family sporulation regulatory protein-aspartic acid phosphatase [Alkaliphilus sp.]